MNTDTVLIFMACSSRKIETTESRPLHELYNGPFWQDLRKRRGSIGWDQVFVLSGKFGFTGAGHYASPYNQRLGPRHAKEIIARGVVEPPRNSRGQVVGMNVVSQVHRQAMPARTVVIQGGELYRRVFRSLVDEIQVKGYLASNIRIIEIPGNAGARAKLRAFLDSL